MQTILHRIEKIAQHENITITALERKIGASKGVLSRAINNGTDIQSKWLQMIADNYPQYSTFWLLTGKGEMLTSTEIKPNQITANRDKFVNNHVEEDYHNRSDALVSERKAPYSRVSNIDYKGKYIETLEKLVASQDEVRKLLLEIEMLKDQGGQDIVVGA